MVMRVMALLLLSGCFPYRELYRPDVSGRVLDETGAAVPGLEVRACSYSRWARPPSAGAQRTANSAGRGAGVTQSPRELDDGRNVDCPRFAAATTDADGGFFFAAVKEWEWCCLGEAPLPMTEVFACSADGGAGFVGDSHGWPGQELLLRLGDGSPRCEQ
jgi:hypothetical protein